MESKGHERKPAEVRKFEILYAARQLFSERGFEGVSMEEIAEKVGLSKAAIYLYFESKLKLFVEMVDYYSERLLSELKDIAKQGSKKPLAEWIDAAYLPLMKGYPVMSICVQMINSGGPPNASSRTWRDFVKKINQLRDRVVALFTDIMLQAQKRGEARRDLPAGDLAMMLIGFASEVAVFGGNYLKTAKDVFLNGILAKEVAQ
jgi:AcrR family transcriptional regulator